MNLSLIQNSTAERSGAGLGPSLSSDTPSAGPAARRLFILPDEGRYCLVRSARTSSISGVQAPERAQDAFSHDTACDLNTPRPQRIVARPHRDVQCGPDSCKPAAERAETACASSISSHSTSAFVATPRDGAKGVRACQGWSIWGCRSRRPCHLSRPSSSDRSKRKPTPIRRGDVGTSRASSGGGNRPRPATSCCDRSAAFCRRRSGRWSRETAIGRPRWTLRNELCVGRGPTGPCGKSRRPSGSSTTSGGDGSSRPRPPAPAERYIVVVPCKPTSIFVIDVGFFVGKKAGPAAVERGVRANSSREPASPGDAGPDGRPNP